MRVLSLGGGTQSTVMALLADEGRFGQRPDVAVFADTGWEPDAVYDNVGWLEQQLSFPVVTVTADPDRSLQQAVTEGVNVRGRPWLTIPGWLADRDGNAAGVNWRQCTTDYKIAPIRAEVRKRLGLKRRSPIPDSTTVEMWLGISADEQIRMRASPDRWIVNRYPLVDSAMSRSDCIAWFAERWPDRRLPRSACAGCPYRSAESWAELRETEPHTFAEAVRIDALLRSPDHHAFRMFRKRVFLHRRRVPLAEAVDADAADTNPPHGAWGNDCAGVCGV